MAAFRLSLIALLACFIGGASAFVAPGAAVRASAVTQQPAAAAVTMMAKAPTKPMRVNKRNYLYNKAYRSEMRTRIKRVRVHAPMAPRLARVGARCTWHALHACAYFVMCTSLPSLASFALCARRSSRRLRRVITRWPCRCSPSASPSLTRTSSVASSTATPPRARRGSSTSR